MIVDNDPQVARFMLEILAGRGICGVIANDEKAAADFLEKEQCDLVFTADKISQRAGLPARPGGSLELLRKIRTDSPELPVVMMGRSETAGLQNQHSLVEAAVNAVRCGCCDFLVKPLNRSRVESLLDTLLPGRQISTAASAQEEMHNIYKIVGKSARLLQTIELAERIAPTSAPVLVSGESGTGKELISYFIHHNSRRTQGPYIRVNCASLNDSLLESELFGHEKGAFTGAYAQRKGRFEMAHGGTLLLDEITETPPRFQAKLLRVLEQQNFERVGGNENVRVDVRIISTTNKNLLQEVQQNRFRQDLYYRLSGVRLAVPPLRQRSEDLPDLVWHFVNLYARQVQRRITALDPVMMNIFTKYHWPGNVRQLRNVVLTSLILGVGQTLSLADVSWLFDELQPLPQEKVSESNSLSMPKETTIPECANADYNLGGIPLEQIEQRAILDTLRQTSGNQVKAAKSLGISDRTLRDKIRRYRRQGVLQAI
jgi:DNA-binding NtrC family response regulator